LFFVLKLAKKLPKTEMGGLDMILKLVTFHPSAVL